MVVTIIPSCYSDLLQCVSIIIFIYSNIYILYIFLDTLIFHIFKGYILWHIWRIFFGLLDSIMVAEIFEKYAKQLYMRFLSYFKWHGFVNSKSMEVNTLEIWKRLYYIKMLKDRIILNVYFLILFIYEKIKYISLKVLKHSRQILWHLNFPNRSSYFSIFFSVTATHSASLFYLTTYTSRLIIIVFI